MEIQSKISVQRVIVHSVDRSQTEADLTDLESQPTKEVREFLEKNITLNSEHKRARKAQFVGGENEIAKIYDDMVSNPANFEDCSKDIARLLHTAMKRGKGSIRPGDLVVCLYMDNKSGLQNLALLKMEPENGFFIQKVEENKKTRVVFNLVRDIFPTKELQKCAFIVPGKLRKKLKYDLIVLDQQTARFGSRRPVASFFQTGFLSCKTDLNSKEQTSLFINQSRNWIEQNKVAIPSGDVERFIQQVNVIADANEVDVDAFAEAVLSNPSDQDAYIDHLKENGLENLKFTPDPKELENWTGYSWFSGDDALEVRIRTDAIGKDRTLYAAKDPNDPNVTVVTIRTINWDPILKRGR
jgi:hypothetical protein